MEAEDDSDDTGWSACFVKLMNLENLVYDFKRAKISLGF